MSLEIIKFKDAYLQFLQTANVSNAKTQKNNLDSATWRRISELDSDEFVLVEALT